MVADQVGRFTTGQEVVAISAHLFRLRGTELFAAVVRLPSEIVIILQEHHIERDPFAADLIDKRGIPFGIRFFEFLGFGKDLVKNRGRFVVGVEIDPKLSCRGNRCRFPDRSLPRHRRAGRNTPCREEPSRARNSRR